MRPNSFKATTAVKSNKIPTCCRVCMRAVIPLSHKINFLLPALKILQRAKG